MKTHKKRYIQLPATIFIYLVLIAVCIVVLYPLIWMIYSSLKLQWEIFVNPFSLPSKPTLDNYVRSWTQGDFGLYFMNSIIVTVPSVAGVVFFSSLAGYAFARFRFKGDKVVFLFFLAGIMIPVQSIIIPSFQIVKRLGLLNTYFALIFTYLVGGRWAYSFSELSLPVFPRRLAMRPRSMGVLSLEYTGVLPCHLLSQQLPLLPYSTSYGYGITSCIPSFM